jgi:hypothetical protein
MTQAPAVYLCPVNIVTLKNIDHAIFIRSKYNHPLFNSFSNGFHYFRQHKDIKNYVPRLPKMPKIKEEKPERPVLGYYVRKYLIPDSWWKFYDIVENYKEEIDVCIMGSPAPELKQLRNVRNYYHTYDNIEFFKKITHYVYPMSRKFIDPFPNSLYEAIQYRKKLIIPKIDRPFKDGIDDIIDCLEDDISLLDWNNFKQFYHNLFNSNFVYNFDRMCYKKFNDWIKGELL